MSLLCQGLKEDPNCHSRMIRNWLGCWEKTLLDNSVTAHRKRVLHYRVLREKSELPWNRHLQGRLKFCSCIHRWFKCLWEKFCFATMMRCMFEHCSNCQGWWCSITLWVGTLHKVQNHHSCPWGVAVNFWSQLYGPLITDSILTVCVSLC